MEAGSNGVTISVTGAKGNGSVIVPITALAGRRLGFTAPRIALGAVCALILAAGFLSILRAAKREGILPPGTAPGPSEDRDARRLMLRGGIFIAGVVMLMSAWWRSVDASFKETMFTAMHVRTRVDPEGDRHRLVLTIDDSLWAHRNGRARRGHVQLDDFVADHGKLMHLFMIANDGRAAFAHLHPHTSDSVTFTAALPPLPAGTYHVFADVVHGTGMTQTLTSSVTLGATKDQAAARTDPDDSWGTGARADAERIALDDGTTLTWIQRPASIAANDEASLRFAITPPPGDTALLQSYLGMPGHAVVVRNDGRVFIHLHPSGTISMAAQSRLMGEAQVPAMQHAGHRGADTLYFPYAFPQPGSYTLWVQIKRRDRIMTGAFTVEVAPALDR
jgi:hypothetical protein